MVRVMRMSHSLVPLRLCGEHSATGKQGVAHPSVIQFTGELFFTYGLNRCVAAETTSEALGRTPLRDRDPVMATVA